METNEQDEMVVPSSRDNRTNVIECVNNILQFCYRIHHLISVISVSIRFLNHASL